MPSMSNLRLVDLCLNYKVQELMEDNGFASTQYRVVDGYPNSIDLKTGELWPTISIEMDSLFGRDVEMGSEQWPGCQFSIDIFAKTDSQRDDLSYIMWKEFNEKYYTLYNFNIAFPTVLGTYTGIPSLGEWYIDNLTSINLSPPDGTVLVGEKHHALLDGLIYLPNI